MRNLYSVLIAISLAAVFSSCGSAQKNATEKLENGEFASALEIFDRILKRDPGNLEAQEGQKRARGGVLADKLIGVRKARDSGSTDAALDQLLEVNTLEAAWNTFPPAAARFTQDEETAFAWKPYAARIDGVINAKQPLRAEQTWKRYAPVFTGPKHASGQASLGATIGRAGRSHCSELANATSPRDPYFTGFVARYCRYWKATAVPRAPVAGARTKDLYSGVRWEGNVSIPAEYQPIIRTELEDAFRKSAWFDPAGGRKLAAILSGTYFFSHTKNLVTRVKEYDERETYTETENVMKTRDVPYSATETYLDPVDSTTKTRSVTRMKSESYWETQPVSRTRYVKKQFPYSALFHQQNIEMTGSLATKIGSQDLTVNTAEKSTAEGDEQTLSNAHVGLEPSRPRLIEPAGWVKGTAGKWGEAFTEKLRSEWISQICRAPESRASASEVAETVLRCRREPAAGSLPYVNDWYVKSFGLPQADVEKLLPEK